MGLSSFFVGVFCVAALAINHSFAIPLHNSSSASNSLIHRTVSQACGTFEGNSDLYGLGIRLGVYLQWISSWLVQTLNPNGVMVTHDANSIFVLAILISMVSATSQHDIKPIESYIMLLICFGYFFTILGFFGVRVQFANPKDLSKLLHRLKPTSATLNSRKVDLKFFWTQFTGISWQKAKVRTSVAVFLDLWKVFKIKVPFGIASYIRHPAVSWSGVAWRIVLAGWLFAFNLWFWWSNFISQWETTNTPSCYGQIYFFGERSLKDRTIRKFFKVSSIILIVPVGFLVSVLFQIVSAMYRFTRDFMLRHMVVELHELVEPGSWNNSSDRWKMAFGLIVALHGSTGTNSLSTMLDVLLEPVTDNKFWTVNKEDIPPRKDLVAGYVQLLSRGMELDSKVLDIPEDSTQFGKKTVGLCLLSHAMTLATIGLFIFFIEATISGNQISHVYTISTTGQLIPFVIGVASSVAALRELLLLWLRRRYPYWSAMKWEAVLGPGSFRVKLTRVAPDNEVESPLSSCGVSFQKENGAWS